MPLRLGLPKTKFKPPRGLGSRPEADKQKHNLPDAHFWTLQEVETYPRLQYAPGAIFVGRVDQTMIGIEDDRHVVTVAGSRSGKTVCLLVPNLKLYPGSVFVIDPKGELARETAALRADQDGLGQSVHVLDPWGVSGLPKAMRESRFDPLADLKATAERKPELRREWVDDAALVAEGLIQDQGENNAHWTESARNVIRGLLLWMLDGGCPDGCSVALLPRLLATASAGSSEDDDDDKDGAPTLWEALAYYQGQGDDVEAVIRNAGEGMLGTARKERASILSTARNQLAFLESAPMAESLSSSTFSLADLKRRPTTIYLCLPAARMGTHARWLRLILNLAMAALEREPTDKEAMPFPVLLMLEEFAALGHMRALEQASAYMAGFGVKLWVVLQDLTQLKRHYKEGWETFLGNAGLVTVFSVSDLTTCEYVSKQLGETTIPVTNKHPTNLGGFLGGDPGERTEHRSVALLTPSEVAMEFRRRKVPDMPVAGLVLVQVPGQSPFVVDRVFGGHIE